MGSFAYDLALSKASKKFLVPYAYEKNYEEKLISLLQKEKPNLVHFQNDLEVWHASQIRDKILSTGSKIFMPPHDTIDKCVHKYKSYLAFKKYGLKIPKNILLRSKEDLKQAFIELADSSGKIWLRSSNIGGGGKGSIPTSDINMATA